MYMYGMYVHVQCWEYVSTEVILKNMAYISVLKLAILGSTVGVCWKLKSQVSQIPYMPIKLVILLMCKCKGHVYTCTYVMCIHVCLTGYGLKCTCIPR